MYKKLKMRTIIKIRQQLRQQFRLQEKVDKISKLFFQWVFVNFEFEVLLYKLIFKYAFQ